MQLVKWRAKLEANAYYQKLIDTHAFKRLYDVSFLGAVDYASDLPEKYSRAEHSLDVASLALLVCEAKSFNEDITRHAVAAALLHDIGHAPLSHSAEPALKKHIGIGHHEMGEMILRGEVNLGQELNHALNSFVDAELVISLLNNELSDHPAQPLFSNSINVDTIDGICRSYRLLSSNKVDRVQIALSAFADCDGESFKLLDSFWSIKHSVYANLIHSDKSILADKISELYFSQLPVDTSDWNSLITTEANWAIQYSGLFDLLNSIRESNATLIEEFAGNAKVYVKLRDYFIDENCQDAVSRYKSQKLHSETTISKLIEGAKDGTGKSIHCFSP